MSKEVIIMTLGVLIAIMPNLGFPEWFDRIFYIVTGIVIACLVFIVRQERLWKEREEASEHRADTFVENGGKHVGG